MIRYYVANKQITKVHRSTGKCLQSIQTLIKLQHYKNLLDMCKDGFKVKVSSDEIFKGDKFALTCDCNAVPEPSYSWTKDGMV